MKWVCLLVLLGVSQLGHCFFKSLYHSISEKLNIEVCTEHFTTPDFMHLRSEFQARLFGQDIIVNKVIPVLESHYKFEPKKALVICMHGWTGSGKNYATKIIVDSLYRKKSESQFVRMFNGRLHFPLDSKDHVDQYKVNLQNWIRGNITNCQRSVFIFDEVDKMPAGVIDSIKPFMDYHERIDSVDYRKAIFMFISNVGAEVINSQYMELWRRGKSRDDMEYKDFEPYLRSALYTTKGGFERSAVLESHLVSLYLPFLPLRISQVRKCIETEFSRQGVDSASESHVDAVLNEMEFNADNFSTSGCKRVADLVASFKYRKRYEEL